MNHKNVIVLPKRSLGTSDLYRVRDIKTLDDLCALLDEVGNDPKTFNDRSLQTLQDLFEEATERDVKLFRGVNSVTGKPELRRLSRSVKVLVDTLDGYQYHEVARWYPKNGGTLIKKMREYSISETCKIGEEFADAAVAGSREEWGMKIKKKQLKIKEWAAPDEPKIYPSTVYDKVTSCNVIQRMGLTLEKRWWKEEHVILKDKRVRVHVECFKMAA